MKQRIAKKYFIGKSTHKGRWASVYAYKPSNEETKKSKGEIFATIALESDPKFAVATAGNMLLDFLHENYFENKNVRVLNALEEAVINTSRHLQLLMQKAESAENGVNMDLTVLVVQNKAVYFVSMGEGVVTLFRDGNLTEIASHLKDPTGEGLVKVGSLLMKEGDVFLLGTPIISDELSIDEMIDLSVNFSEVELKRHTFKNESQVALFLIGYDVDPEEAKEELALHEKIKSEVVQSIEELPDRSENVIEEKEDRSEEYVDEQEESNPNPIWINLKSKAAELQTKLVGAISNLRNKDKDYQQAIPEIQRQSQLHDIDTEGSEPETTYSEQKTYQVILQKAGKILKNVGHAIKATVWDDWLAMGDDGVYVKGSRFQRKRNVKFLIVLALVVLGILYFSIRNIINGIEQRKVNQEAEIKLAEIEELINDVDELAEVKASADSSDPVKRDLYQKLDDAESKLGEVPEDEKFKEEVQAHKDKIQELRDVLNLIIAVTEPRLVLDIGGKFPGGNPADIAINNGQIYIVDNEFGKIYQVDYSGATPTEVVSGLTRPKTMAVDDNGDLIVLDEDGDRRLATIKISDGSINRHAGTSEFRVGNVSDIDFANIFGGRVYGIDQSSKQVIVLQRSGESYGIPQNRFALDALQDAPDLQVIDLKIYMLVDVNQGLYRFFNDADDTPAIKGLNPGENLYNATALYVDGTYMYFADPQNRRILVFTKGESESNLVGQYVYRGSDSNAFSDIKEIVADIQSRTLFVLDGSKIYSLDLNALN